MLGWVEPCLGWARTSASGAHWRAPRSGGGARAQAASALCHRPRSRGKGDAGPRGEERAHARCQCTRRGTDRCVRMVERTRAPTSAALSRRGAPTAATPVCDAVPVPPRLHSRTEHPAVRRHDAVYHRRWKRRGASVVARGSEALHAAAAAAAMFRRIASVTIGGSAARWWCSTTPCPCPLRTAPQSRSGQSSAYAGRPV